MLTILPHMALTALHVHTRPSMDNIHAVCRFGVADRTPRPTSSEGVSGPVSSAMQLAMWASCELRACCFGLLYFNQIAMNRR
jgi:hypothetical protein